MEYSVIQDSIIQRINDIPVNMTVEDVARFLGVSASTAYKVIKQDEFPKLRIPGRRLVIIPKHLFFDWYASCGGQKKTGIGDIIASGRISP